MREFTSNYLQVTKDCINNFKAFRNTIEMEYEEAVNLIVDKICIAHTQRKKILFAGNGGSAGITSHMALDFWKNAGVKAMAFNDPSLLTALGNDIGYEYVFSKPVEMFGEVDDIFIGISSSGNSPNIVNAAIKAKEIGCFVVTLSGFDSNNSLKQLGDVNLYIPSNSYGLVEVLHTLMIHNILDEKLYCIDKIDIYNKNNFRE